MATREEMMQELRDAGETVAHNIKTASLVDRYNERFGISEEDNADSFIPMPTPEVPKTPTAPKAKTKKVIIHSNDRENDEPDMIVGHKGEVHKIKIGEEVDLDIELIAVIKDAVETKHVSVLDKTGQPTGEIVEKPRPRYLTESVEV